MRKQNGMIQHRLAWIIAITAAVVLSAGPASGQFVIKPMRLNLTPRPGERLRETFELQNHDADMSPILDLRVIELGQSENGTWQIVEPNDPNAADLISRLSSCREWITLGKHSVEVGPHAIVPIDVTVRVPPRIRGFYGAAILATVRKVEDPNVYGWPVNVQFLIPVFAQIQGRVTRHQVSLKDVGLEFHPPTADSEAATVATMNVANTGGTYSSVKGFLRIRAFQGGHWREIATTEFKDTGIIPGMDFRLVTDTGRALPAGKYKLEGALYVDAQLTKRVQKEIDFVGDPSAVRIAVDAALVLNPTELVMKTSPGGTRMGTITIYNGADEDVNISVAVGLPRSLLGVALGDLRGEDLSCTQWLKIAPEQFTLRGNGGRRNVTVTARMPNPGANHAAYYALIGVRGTYADGQSAGVRTAIVSIANQNIQARRFAQYAGPLKIDLLEEAKYLVRAGFYNVGNIHFTPRCTAIVTTVQGARVGTPILLSGMSGLMLPLESRGYSGVLDVSELLAGIYRVTATLEYGPGQTARSEQIIQISGPPGGQRDMEIMG